jgi:hypothetical protein
MKRLLWICAFVCLPAYAAPIPIIGTVRTPQGNLLNGRIDFTLSYAASRDTSANNVTVAQVVSYPVRNGILPANAQIVPNSVLEPGNTTYTAEYFTSSGQKIGQNIYFVSGTQFNIGTATPTVITTSNISFAIGQPWLDCTGMSGTTASRKITTCSGNAPAAGGSIAYAGTGSSTWDTDAFSGISKNLDFYCSGVTFVVSINSTIPANVHLIAGEGCVFSVNSGINFIVYGPMDGSSAGAHFSGSGFDNAIPAFVQGVATGGDGNVRAFPPPGAISFAASNHPTSGAYSVVDPWGTAVNCTASTTRCIQEAINTAYKTNTSGTSPTSINGYDLTINGGDWLSGGALGPGMSPSFQYVFPASQGKTTKIQSNSLNAIKIDSSEMLDFSAPGSQISGVWFKPVRGSPLDGLVSNEDSRFQFTTVLGSSIADSYGQTGAVLFDTAGNTGMTSSYYQFNEVNDSSSGNAYGIKVHSVPSGANFTGNIIQAAHIHSNQATNTCVKMGDGAPFVGQTFGQNLLQVNCSLDTTASNNTFGLDTYASNDVVFLNASFTSLATPLKFESGSLGNFVVLQSNQGAPIIVDANTTGTSTNLTWVNGNTAIVPGGVTFSSGSPNGSTVTVIPNSGNTNSVLNFNKIGSGTAYAALFQTNGAGFVFNNHGGSAINIDIKAGENFKGRIIGQSNILEFQGADGLDFLQLNGDGSTYSNLGYNSASFGGGKGVIGVGEANTIPSTNPSGGFILYQDPMDHKVYIRGQSGTVTPIANP